MEIEKGPRIGVPAGARAVLLRKAIEDPLTEEEKAKFEAVIGPAPAAFPPAEVPQALVVEDEPHMRGVITSILKQWDLQVTPVGSGTEALKVMGTRRVDFIVTDLKLPGHDGYEIVRCARSYLKLRQTEIVMLSSELEPREELVALNLGADAFMRKPILPEFLQARLKPMVRRLYDRLGG